jgi:Reverse transcriptase (RNA-dependent DNA polymerase)
VQLIAKGYSQVPSKDFNATFSPVMRLNSLQILIALTAIKDLDSGQMDIKGAFLNPYLKEDIYMQQPKGYEDGTGKVCHLRHAVSKRKLRQSLPLFAN